jgi:hypothetical protein
LQRFLSTGVVLGLLVATAAAFAITESLKLTQSPLTRTQVSKVLSPVCGCDTRTATIQFWLRKRDVLTLSVVDPRRQEVKRLVDQVAGHPRWNTFQWDGRTSSGSVAEDGTYYVRVHLKAAHRTIQLPNRIELDTRAPRVLDVKPNRRAFSPDGDGQSDSVKLQYRLSEPGHALLFLRGKQIVRTRFERSRGTITWYGRVGGVPLRQGSYRLRVGAVDAAGNVTGPKEGAVVLVKVRYVALAKHAIPDVNAGTRFGVGIDTDSASYTWQLGPDGGISSSRVLVVRAPALAGTYRLVVSANGHRDAATVVVVPRR